MASSITRYLVLDDDDTSITYSGFGWTREARWNGFGFNGNVHRGTEHMVSENSSLTFTYRGQGYIIALGTVPFRNSTTPSWSCSIDGVQAPNYNGTGDAVANNWYMCYGRMTEGVQHTFRMDITIPEASSFPFYFDRFMYEPSPNDRHENVDALLFSTDPTFHYEGQWDLLNENTLITRQQGASARLDFVGSSVSTYAFIEAMNATTGSTGSYHVDGGEETRFFWIPPTGVNDTLGNQLMFTTPELEVGAHSLEITYLSDGTQTSPLSINFVLIHNGSFPVMTTVTDSSGPGRGGSNNNNTDSGDNRENGGGGGLGRSGTIGVAVAVPLAVLTLLAGALLFWRHRKQQQSKDSMNRDEIDPQETSFTPFPLPPNLQHLQQQQQQQPLVQHIHYPREKQNGQTGTGPVVMGVSRRAESVTSGAGTSELSSTSSPSPVTSGVNTTVWSPYGQTLPHPVALSPVVPGMQHIGSLEPNRQVDSGIRFQNPASSLPPFYTPS